jgi:hypothetical protein
MSPAIPMIPLTPYYEAPAGPSTGQRPRLDVPLLLIHPIAWKVNSANYFAFTEFYEVRLSRFLGSADTGCSRGTAGTHGFEACTHSFHQEDFRAAPLVQGSRRV